MYQQTKVPLFFVRLFLVSNLISVKLNEVNIKEVLIWNLKRVRIVSLKMMNLEK